MIFDVVRVCERLWDDLTLFVCDELNVGGGQEDRPHAELIVVSARSMDDYYCQPMK